MVPLKYWGRIPMKIFRLIAIMLVAMLLTGTLALLTMGCDEEKDNNSSLLLFLGRGAKRMFVTTATTTGTLGADAAVAIVHADDICMSDINKPSDSSTWKALIVSSARSITNGWVLKPYTKYTRVDGTVIGTTNKDHVLEFFLTNAITASASTNWTGLNFDWNNAINNCTNWTGTGTGEYGTSQKVGAQSIAAGASTCGNSYHIICVEQ
jgi:hypothetical protein